MLGDVSSWVALDQEVEETWLVVTGDWGIRANNLLLDGSSIGKSLWERRRDGDVLADWETKDGGWGREGETVDGGVVGEDGFLGELKVLELLLEDWLRRGLYFIVSGLYLNAEARVTLKA